MFILMFNSIKKEPSGLRRNGPTQGEKMIYKKGEQKFPSPFLIFILLFPSNRQDMLPATRYYYQSGSRIPCPCTALCPRCCIR